jgi:hypothetical protein
MLGPDHIQRVICKKFPSPPRPKISVNFPSNICIFCNSSSSSSDLLLE